jgi:urease alpha subunit
LITINPAKQLGIENKVGSLEVGKDADVVIFDNHPLSIYGIPQLTIVDGIIRFDRQNDADDQRLDVDPIKAASTYFRASADHNDDRCLEGVYEMTLDWFKDK